MKWSLKGKRWYQQVLIVLVVLYLLYIVLAPLLVATWGRQKVVDSVADLTGRQVSLESLRFNPFTNRIVLKNFAIKGKQGKKVIGFSRLSVNVGIWPLLQQRLYLGEVTLQSPFVRLVRLSDGKQLNLVNLFTPETTKQSATKTTATTKTPSKTKSSTLPLVIEVAQAIIDDGQLVLEDKSLTDTPRVSVGHLRLQAGHIVIKQGEAFQFQLHFSLQQGGSVAIDGSLTPFPFALQTDVDISALALSGVSPWLTNYTGLALASGTLTSQIHARISAAKTQLDGQLSVVNVQLNNPIAARSIALKKANITALHLQVAVPEITLDAKLNAQQLIISRHKDGNTKPLLSLDKVVSQSINVAVADNKTEINAGVQLQGLQLSLLNGKQVMSLPKANVTGVTLGLKRHLAQVDMVSLAGLTGGFVLGKANTTASQLLSAWTGGGTTMPAAKPHDEKPQAQQEAAPTPWHIKVNKVQVDAKSLTFQDKTVSPNYQVALRPLSLSLQSVDSGTKKPASISLKGKLDGDAPLSISGNVNLFSELPSVSLEVDASHYDMAQLTPYIAPIVGYRVRKGLLSVDSKVELQRNHLQSESQIKAAQFELGQKVTAPDAINAPVKLGLAILRDGNGNIQLPLHVNGDLSSPSISVVGLVQQAIVNVLMKVATSPLSVLSLITGQSNLDRVVMAPGKTTAATKDVKTLANLLSNRPALQLVLKGSASQADNAKLTDEYEDKPDREEALKQLAKERAEQLKEQLQTGFHIDPSRLHLAAPRINTALSGVSIQVYLTK